MRSGYTPFGFRLSRMLASISLARKRCMLRIGEEHDVLAAVMYSLRGCRRGMYALIDAVMGEALGDASGE